MLPAAVSLRKQGANKGAVTAFLISTPESGVDSIAITWALLDPVLTVMRPVAAFVTATMAGIAENIGSRSVPSRPLRPDLSCPVDGCCDGIGCDPRVHRHHHGFFEKLFAGIRYAFTEFWDDLAGYFFLGLLLAGLITVLVPDRFFTAYLGGGLTAMLAMLVAGTPLYVCATASTPIAAAMILKGLSPGAALVFLLVGPATNVATLTVLAGTLGRRSVAIYLTAIVVCAVSFGLVVDEIYAVFGLSASGIAGHAHELVPHWLAMGGSVFLILLSVRGLYQKVKRKLAPTFPEHAATSIDDKPPGDALPISDCGPG